MVGVTDVNVDVPVLNGTILAIQSVLVECGLVSSDEFDARAAEGRVTVLRQILGNIQAAKQQAARKQLNA